MRLDQKKKKSFQLPHVMVILIGIMLVVTIMSFFIPSGQFVRDANGAVDPTQFSYVENENPISFFDFFYAIPHGIVESANIIVSIMVISGVLYVIEQTGAIAAGLQRLTMVAKGKEIVVVLFLTFIFGILGVIGWGEDALPFIPMVASLALALGYDRIVGVGIVQLGVCIGFTTGAFNIFTTGICQELAGISIFSAWGFRLIEFLVCFVVLSLFLISYCRKIKRAPSKSVMPNFLEEQQQEQKIMSERVPMTARRIATLVVLLLAFVGQAVGAVQFGWDMEDISGLYIIVAVVVAIINGINPSKVCVDFIKGTTTVISAVIVIGVARAIYLLMEQAQMVDTIIHSLATLFEGKSPFVIILLLYLFVIAFNFFVVSASGKAFILFPMLKPLADILGINQQVVVTTFQLGDGFTNYIFPSAGALMASLELGGVTYQQWLKFAGKIIFTLVLVGAGFSFLAQIIGLS